MAKDATLHVKLDSETDQKLRRLAAARGKSKGELVRDAIRACYQTSFEDLSLRQRQAIAAYQGGYVSLGRLAREMGMHALELREWLAERGIEPLTAFGDQDAQLA